MRKAKLPTLRVVGYRSYVTKGSDPTRVQWWEVMVNGQRVFLTEFFGDYDMIVGVPETPKNTGLNRTTPDLSLGVRVRVDSSSLIVKRCNAYTERRRRDEDVEAASGIRAAEAAAGWDANP